MYFNCLKVIDKEYKNKSKKFFFEDDIAEKYQTNELVCLKKNYFKWLQLPLNFKNCIILFS